MYEITEEGQLSPFNTILHVTPESTQPGQFGLFLDSKMRCSTSFVHKTFIMVYKHDLLFERQSLF